MKNSSHIQKPPPALEAQGLNLAWNDGPLVVEGLNLTLNEGQTVCLVGKSGIGKTTILHALAGLLLPHAGRVFLHGQDITGRPGQVSYMLQKDLLLPNLKVLDNACLPLVLAGRPKAQAREQALELLERFGLAEVADKWPAQLSGGMRQRVAFARTYLQGNSVVLLDEPFSALDALTRAKLRTWFKDMSAELGLSSIIITHDADEAALLADHIYVLGKRDPDPTSSASIVGEVVPQQKEGARDYSLTPAFLNAKSAILEML